MKRRRWLAVAVALLLLLGILPFEALAAMRETPTQDYCPANRDHRHTFQEAGRQGDCGSGRIEITYRCRACGYTYTDSQKASHSYGKWKTTKEPTCTSTGERQRKCSVCGHVQKDKAPSQT